MNRKVGLRYLPIAILALLVLSILPLAYAQTPDVVNDPDPYTEGSYITGLPGDYVQTFIPATADLTAVDLRIRNAATNEKVICTFYLFGRCQSWGTVLVGVDVDVSVLILSESSELLGWRTVTVLGPCTTYQVTQGECSPEVWVRDELVRFDFSTPIPTAPGDTYRIQLGIPSDYEVGWFFRNDDPYPNGFASGPSAFNDFCQGGICDFNFITYCETCLQPQGVPEFDASITIMTTAAVVLTLFVVKRQRRVTNASIGQIKA